MTLGIAYSIFSLPCWLACAQHSALLCCLCLTIGLSVLNTTLAFNIWLVCAEHIAGVSVLNTPCRLPPSWSAANGWKKKQQRKGAQQTHCAASWRSAVAASYQAHPLLRPTAQQLLALQLPLQQARQPQTGQAVLLALAAMQQGLAAWAAYGPALAPPQRPQH